MKHNKLVRKFLSQFPECSEVFFKTPDSTIPVPVGYQMYEVANTLVFFKGEDNDEVARIKDLLSIIDNNCYTNEDECIDNDFMVAICNILDWDDDNVGFANLLYITDAVQSDNKVILTTIPFNDATANESSERLTVVSADSRLLNKFIEEITELRNSPEFNKSIYIF